MTQPSDRERLGEIALRLLDRTVNGKAHWEETDLTDTFMFSTSNSSITIRKTRFSYGDTLTLRVLNIHGSLVEELSISDDELQHVALYRTLNRLWEEARRDALSIEEVLTGILDELGE